jgi:hypothetical protein
MRDKIKQSAILAGTIGLALAGLQLSGADTGAIASAPLATSAYLYEDVETRRVMNAWTDAMEADRIMASVNRPGKGDKLTAASFCNAETWPAVSGACVALASGTAPRQKARTVTVEYRPVSNVSVLVRMPADRYPLR